MKRFFAAVLDVLSVGIRSWKWINEAPSRLALVAGVLAVWFGVYLIYPPAALIIIGICLVYLAKEMIEAGA